MRGSAKMLAGVAVAAWAASAGLALPRPAGEPSAQAPVETWISGACGGAEPCERWQGVQHLDLLLARTELPAGERLRLAATIVDESAGARLDPHLVLAMIEVESGFDVEAVSHRGAMGLMQLKPSTLIQEAVRSRLLADDLEDPVLNVRAGIRYFRRLLDDFRQDQDLALMAYNAGPQRISRLRREEGGIPEHYRAYPRRVRAELRRLRGEEPRVAMAEGAAPGAGLR